MSRRKKIVLILVVAAGLAVAIFFAHPCRDPDPPDHPVPVVTDLPPGGLAAPD